MSPRTVAPAIALEELTEKQFEQQLIGTKSRPGVARMLGWKAYHTLRSKGSEPGYPDWTLVRDRVVFIECKSETGTVKPAQREWFAALANAGAEIYLVRPRHLEAIATVLRHRYRPREGEQPLLAALHAELEAELAHLTTEGAAP